MKSIDEVLQEFGKKQENIDAYRVACGRVGEELMLNMADDWKDLTEKVWQNDQNCPCAAVPVTCPCKEGLELALKGGKCHCGLFLAPQS